MQIKIISRPNCDVPDWVDKALVGLVFDADTDTDEFPSYVFDIVKMLEALKIHNPEAYEWWKEHMEFKKGECIIRTGCCRQVS